jgi:hypothetical protein
MNSFMKPLNIPLVFRFTLFLYASFVSVSSKCFSNQPTDCGSLTAKVGANTTNRNSNQQILPNIPRNFGVSREMAKKAENADATIRKFNICGGGAHCKTPVEKIDALKRAILRAQSEGGEKLAELSQAKADLEFVWGEAEKMHREFLALNQARAFPFGFTTQEQWNDFRQPFLTEIRSRLAQPGNQQIQVLLGGSSIEGLSFLPKDQGLLRKPFGPESDLDILVVVPERLFKRLFPSELEKDFVERTGVSYPLDMDKLSKAFSEGLAPDTELRNLKHFLDQQQAKINGRKISLKFTTEAPTTSTAEKFRSLGD